MFILELFNTETHFYDTEHQKNIQISTFKKKKKSLFQIGFQVHFQWPVFDFKLNFDLRPSTFGFKFSDVPSDVIKHLLTVFLQMSYKAVTGGTTKQQLTH